MRSGADALIIEGMEAGGHIGPVATSVLAQEILPELAGEVPVFVAGRDDPARRFVALVDEFYDRGVKLVLSAAAAPTELYHGERLRRGETGDLIELGEK